MPSGRDEPVEMSSANLSVLDVDHTMYMDSSEKHSMADGRRNEYENQSVDEVIGWAVYQYRHHLELVYPFLLFGIASLLLEFRFELLWDLFEIDPGVGVTADPTPIRDVVSEPLAEAITAVLEEVFVLFVLGVLFLFVLTFVFFLFAAGIAFLVVADERGKITRTQSARAVVVVRRLPALLVASLIGSLVIFVGTILFVIPGLYLAVRLSLGGPAIVIDNHGPISGLRASWRRSAGQLFEIGTVVIGGAVVISLTGFIPLLGEAISVLVLLPVTMLSVSSLYVEALSPKSDLHPEGTANTAKRS